MVFSIVQGYVFARLIGRGRRKKLFLTLSLVLSFALLGYCKYADFFIENFNAVTGLSLPLLKIALPIGISFYTFQTMSYVIDVYRDDAPVSKNFINFGTYVALFPQLIAGPIVRYRDVAEQLVNRRETLEMFTKGVKLFMVGLAKKVIIANTMGTLTTNIFATTDENGVVGTWVGMIAYTFQIYFDFSGYSDMACGLGNMMGFEFLKNFNYPYIAKSITDFWRRWHISLSTWFKEYVYIPLGGNRKGVKRQILNLLIVWGLTGLWHGAAYTFILWGFVHGIYLVIEDIVKTAEKYGKNILFVATPYKYSRSRFPYQCALNAYMEKMQYPYLNLDDEQARRSIDLDYDTDFYNSLHVNFVGAEKITSYLAAYMKGRYRFTNKLDDKQKKEWENAVSAWDEDEILYRQEWNENCKQAALAEASE